MGLVKISKERIEHADLEEFTRHLEDLVKQVNEKNYLDALVRLKLQAIRIRELTEEVTTKPPSKQRLVDKAKQILEMDMDILMSSDINIVRGACDGHDPCPNCQECTKCTIPHWCCCGRCGAKCNHQHAPIRSICFRMQELHHSLESRAEQIRDLMVMDESSGVTEDMFDLTPNANMPYRLGGKKKTK
jgi:hypothetical protein